MKVLVGKWAYLRLIPENPDEVDFLRCLTSDEFRLQRRNYNLLGPDKGKGPFLELELQQHQPERWKSVLNYVSAVEYGKALKPDDENE